ncbi:hypothetical protein [Streptomyces huiliensis]|uniref:hypothetical protein n=1 Tax=Streptomyces huiliensis TaxID=2876027 RepID=UPI001CBE3325|nr:hypothetical protein [Streptomyces huiliensis]MBZ4319827.1 hypothetical protein [Streptomyces huiliensis]
MNVSQEDAPEAVGDVPRWMAVVSTTADILLLLFKSVIGGSKGRSGATAGDGGGDGDG